MKRLTIVMMVLVGGIVLTTVATADDIDDVKAAVLAVDDAFKTKDVDAIARYMHPDHSRFFAGGLLIEGFSKEPLKAFFDAGGEVDLVSRHLGVKIYGNTAVVTGYNEGTVTSPDGNVDSFTLRFSEIWIKQEGQWKRVHIHSSQLIP